VIGEWRKDGYRCIVVDPPWDQKGGGPHVGREGFGDATGASKPMPYRTMSLAGIRALPVAALADPDGCHLYLWTTNGFLRHAFDVMLAWGFSYSTTLVWAKTPMGGGLGGDAFGIATEFVLFGRRGALPALSRFDRTWFNWKRQYDHRGKPMHSAKPEGFYVTAEAVSPGPRLDMFARRMRMGWDAWGDQAPSSTLIPELGGVIL
jgi:N6-adenosine-specific RNA methylase IME4